MDPDVQLRGLATPFTGDHVKPAPSGKYGSYVPHFIVAQRLLLVVGPYSWRITQTIRDASGTLTGCIGEITCTVDGREVTVAGAGNVENPEAVTKAGNDLHESDGERLKLAESDAFKRAAMRLGCGLHLWAQNDYYLADRLRTRHKARVGDDAQESEPGTDTAESGEVGLPGLDDAGPPLFQT